MGASWWGRGALLLLLLVVGGEAGFRCRGGAEEGSGPSVSSAGPRPGVPCPLGGSPSLPTPSVVGQVTLGVAGLSPASALRCGRGVEWGRWGLGSRGRGLTPALPAPKALRTVPLPASPPPGLCLLEAPPRWGWGAPEGAPAACLPPPRLAPLSPAPGGCDTGDVGTLGAFPCLLPPQKASRIWGLCFFFFFSF